MSVSLTPAPTPTTIPAASPISPAPLVSATPVWVHSFIDLELPSAAPPVLALPNRVLVASPTIRNKL